MGYDLAKWYPDVMAQVLLLMRVGRPEAPDTDVFTRVAAEHLQPGFDADRPWESIWYGLAAQRVGNAEWTDRIIGPLSSLPHEEITQFDALRCSQLLEALTGGTRP